MLETPKINSFADFFLKTFCWFICSKFFNKNFLSKCSRNGFERKLWFGKILFLIIKKVLLSVSDGSYQMSVWEQMVNISCQLLFVCSFVRVCLLFFFLFVSLCFVLCLFLVCFSFCFIICVYYSFCLFICLFCIMFVCYVCFMSMFVLCLCLFVLF